MTTGNTQLTNNNQEDENSDKMRVNIEAAIESSREPTLKCDLVKVNPVALVYCDVSPRQVNKFSQLTGRKRMRDTFIVRGHSSSPIHVKSDAS